MIEIEKAKQKYIKYAESFNIQKNEYLKNKIDHSLRVMKLCTKIAESINLSQEEIQIATLIGLLHDIGRYKEYEIKQTQNKYIDHGELGAQILKENNFIREFIKTNKYDNIILTAIKEHNKYKESKELENKEKIFTKIIRDADKLDIFYECEEFYWKNDKEELEKEKITPKDIDPFIQEQNIERRKNKENRLITRALTTMSFIFDLNFEISFKILKQQDYINKYINKFQFKDKQTQELINKVQKLANQYINNKQKSHTKGNNI